MAGNTAREMRKGTEEETEETQWSPWEHAVLLALQTLNNRPHHHY